MSDPQNQERGLSRRDPDEILLEQALTDGIRVPLAALRVSMEGLVERLEAGSEEERLTRSVLGAMERMASSVDELIHFFSLPAHRPLRCTLGEIVSTVRARLGDAHAERLVVASDCTADTLLVDGPLLIQILSRLVGAAAGTGTDTILLTVRTSPEDVRFGVVSRPGRRSRRPYSESVRELSDYLAARDALLMRAALQIKKGHAGHSVTTLSLAGCCVCSVEAAA
ncbi:MAG TPA: hypothetical protein ENJ09_10405 [Planctomycetes bacterium]|nr:hypothetical protein [Planctomycetota bacterium]